MSEKTCPICGKPTAILFGNAQKEGLCIEHSKLAKNGKLEFCSKCTTWHATNEPCNCNPWQKTINTPNPYSKNCIICKQPTNKKYFCNDCTKGIQAVHKDISHLENLQQAREYYSNLKNSIFWINKMEYAQNACRKLYAIAEVVDACRDLGQRQQIQATKDITYLLKKKQEYLEKEAVEKEKTPETKPQEDEVSIEIADYRKVNPANIHCRDGHYVRSPYEKIIDDTLYTERIFHEYEKKYKALDGHSYYPDFYLPDFDLYIEYFGMNENKQKNLYKKEIFEKDTVHNFAFIWSEQNGVLDEIILDIIDEYKRKKGQK